MPIPCVDIIVYREDSFLMGWRSIPPYKNVWALIGGRILRGETLEAAAVRQCLESGLKASNVQQLGLYPVIFPSRHDLSICFAAKLRSGNPTPTKEMPRYRWWKKHQLSKISPIGANYKRMLHDWIRSIEVSG